MANLLAEPLFNLYQEHPTRQLYHYTSLSGLMGIVESKSLYATDIRYFNDAAEMQHTVNLIRSEVSVRLRLGHSNPKLLDQLQSWVSDRLKNGHMLFVVSFTANGNLLSQWRGYCPKGEGVSIGFNQEVLRSNAESHSFSMGRCRYKLPEQQRIVEDVVDAIEELALQRGENLDPSKRNPSQSFYDIFEEMEDDVLKIAALLKHPAFLEEEEWRAVSPIYKNYISAPISYRVGRSMLLPSVPFHLPKTETGAIAISHAFLGPTPNVDLSMTSLSRYLAKVDANPKDGLIYCQIPYRDW